MMEGWLRRKTKQMEGARFRKRERNGRNHLHRMESCKSKLGANAILAVSMAVARAGAGVRKALDETACNALLLKVNQIGSVTESIEACKMSMDNNWGAIVSHRSGEDPPTSF